LTDRACAKCGQGLYSADDCLKVYQKQYVAPPPPAPHQVNQSQDSFNRKLGLQPKSVLSPDNYSPHQDFINFDEVDNMVLPTDLV
jgi:hypothetical protein